MENKTNETTARAKRYNVTGVITNVQVRQDKNGNDWVAFKLRREGKRTISGAAFADKAKALLEMYNEGDEAKVFGYFEPREFTVMSGEDAGKVIRYSRLNVLAVGDHREEQQVETQAEAA